MASCVYRFGHSFAAHSDYFARSLSSLDEGFFSEIAFARIQRRTLENDLQDLARRCHDRLVHVFQLLNPAAPLPKNLLRYGPDVLDRLIYPWDRLAALYRSLHFDPQFDFLDDHRLREERKWRGFVEETCMTPLTTHPEWTRALLEGVGVLDGNPSSTSPPVENNFAAIIATLKGEDHEHAWLI